MQLDVDVSPHAKADTLISVTGKWLANACKMVLEICFFPVKKSRHKF